MQNNGEEFGRLATELFNDLQRGVILWQALVIAVALLIAWQGSRLLQRRFSKVDAGGDARLRLRHTLSPGGLLRTWEVAISWLVWLGLAMHLTGLSPAVLQFLDETALKIGQQRISLSMVLVGLLTVFIALFAALWIGRLFENRIMSMDHVERARSRNSPYRQSAIWRSTAASLPTEPKFPFHRETYQL
jgi:hypothetical protein